MGDCLLSNFGLAKLHFDRSNIIRNFKVIYARNFSLCCVQLLYIQTCNKKDRQIDCNILYLSWFWDYPQRGTQGYRFFCGYHFVCCWINNKAMKYYYPLFIYFFSREDELDAKSNDKCSNTFRRFLMMN